MWCITLLKAKRTFSHRPHFLLLVFYRCFVLFPVCFFLLAPLSRIHMSHQFVQRARHKPKHLYLHTLLAVVRLFPFHFTNSFWLHTFLICPILVPSTFFRCRRIPKCQTTFPGMLHFKKHSRSVITSGSQAEGKIKSHNYTSTDTVIYTWNQSLTWQNMCNKRPPLCHLSSSRKPKSCVVRCLFFAKVLIARSRSKVRECLKWGDKKLPSAIVNRNS